MHVTRRIAVTWHPAYEELAEFADEPARSWSPGTRGIDSAAWVIAATAVVLEARLLTRNINYCPMFEGSTTPY